MGAGPRPALVLHRRDVDHVYMDAVVDHLRTVALMTEGVTTVLVAVVTAPVWLPTYVGIVAMRYVMGRDQSNDAS